MVAVHPIGETQVDAVPTIAAPSLAFPARAALAG